MKPIGFASGILLLGLAAGVARAATVTLGWNAVTTNADGTPISDLSGYRVFYATHSLLGMTTAQAMSAGSVARPSAGNAVTFPVTNLNDATTYYFRLTAYDASGNQSDFCDLPPEVSTFIPAPAPPPVSAGLTPTLPGLKEAYVFPNPAVGSDPTIRAMMGGVDSAEITIFDQSGRVVKSDRVTQSTVVNGQPAHEYAWKGEKASGVYYAVIHGRKGNEVVRARAKFAVVR